MRLAKIVHAIAGWQPVVTPLMTRMAKKI